MLLDVEIALRRLQESRRTYGLGHENPDLVAHLVSMVQRIEHRAQLDRLVAGLDAGAGVADRIEQVLVGGWVVRTDEELTHLAAAQTKEMRRRAEAGRAPASRADVQIIDRLQKLPIVVLDAAESDDSGVIMNGVWNHKPSTRKGPLTEDDLSRLATLEAEWPVYAETLRTGWHPVAASLANMVGLHDYINRWVLSPATEGALETEQVYRIWQAQAHLRIQVDRVAVVRSTTNHPVSVYSQAVVAPKLSDGVTEWLKGAGEYGARALEIALRAEAAWASGDRPHAYLYLESLSLTSVPPVEDMAPWTHVAIVDNAGIDLSSLTSFESLELLAVQGCLLTEVPPIVRDLRALRRLNLADNPIELLPAWVTELVNLEELHLSGTGVSALPDFVGQLGQLQTLGMIKCGFVEIPGVVAELPELRSLLAESNAIERVPDWIGSLSSLRELRLDNNQIQRLPTSIGDLSNLRVLSLRKNPLETLPREILSLDPSCEINLASTGLPPAIEDAPTIRELSRAWDGGSQDRWNLQT